MHFFFCIFSLFAYVFYLEVNPIARELYSEIRLLKHYTVKIWNQISVYNSQDTDLLIHPSKLEGLRRSGRRYIWIAI